MLQLPDKVVHNGVDLKKKTGDKNQLILAYAIALWYNGVPFVNDGKIYHIGSSPPPKLRTLIGCSESQWRSTFEPILDMMQKKGQLKEQTILRRKVKWVPDIDFRKTIGEIFSSYMTDLALIGPVNENVGLVGDWNESLIHRMGVERLRAIQERRGCHTDIYPDVKNETTPDIYWFEGPYFRGPRKNIQTYYNKWAGEVLTDHNNVDVPKQKYQAFSSDPNINYVWVFEDRRHAAMILNILQWSDNIDCSLVNGDYNKPRNYSIKKLNEYVARSKSNPEYNCGGIDRVTTLTALQNQISEPHGNLQYRRPPSDRDLAIVS